MIGAELRARAIQPDRPFLERFQELADMGLRDVDMPRRIGLTADSLVRMMLREGLSPSPLLREIAWDGKRK